jgi:hypothetical protein
MLIYIHITISHYLLQPSIQNQMRGFSVVPLARLAAHPRVLPPRYVLRPLPTSRTLLTQNINCTLSSRKLSTSFVLVHYPSPILSYIQRTELRWAPDVNNRELTLYSGRPFFWAPPISSPVSPKPPSIS